MERIHAKDIPRLLKKGYILVDVREEFEWEEGIIEGAQKISTEDLTSDYSKLKKNKKYIVYCRTGNRSERICEDLENNGFKNVSNLEGGYEKYLLLKNQKEETE